MDLYTSLHQIREQQKLNIAQNRVLNLYLFRLIFIIYRLYEDTSVKNIYTIPDGTL